MRVPVAQMHMHLAHLTRMRHDGQAVGECEVGDLDIFGDAAKPRHVRLDIGNRAGIDEGTERIHRIKLLPSAIGMEVLRASRAWLVTSSYQSGSSNQ